MLQSIDTVSLLMQLAQTEGASDLIITEGNPPQLRIYNELISLGKRILTAEDTERMCLHLLTKDQARKFLKNKELDISYHIPDIGRFRINFYQQRGCLALAARLIYEQIPDFQKLKLPDIVRQLAARPLGLVLITGPIGSGKSTTVAAMVNYINQTRKCHIICIEDPIEYIYTNQQATIDQREVGIDTHSYTEALRRILRQSMDVVVLGEIRDRVSAQAAMTLAETGHLTLATLHTNGTVASVNRLVDMFPPEQAFQIRVQLASSLAGVIWQQLLPGNDKCLTVACEIMIATPGIRSLIRQGKTHEIYSLIEAGRKYEMRTMKQTIEELIIKGALDSEWINNYT
ncbi:MAG: PilT/PilU family type 4a pilus ATPase, partial [Sedimentisphaerales bacterium]|nr:PilT/PilU family type 4a pilus ATPase [Sedimentisphaerales bacterium]